MKINSQRAVKVRSLLGEAITGVEGYLNDWSNAPRQFTTVEELKMFAATLREMRDSLNKEDIVPIVGLWRIMETWPYNNEIRKKIVEAEYEYERLK